MEVPLCQGCGEREARIAALEAGLAELEAKAQEQARLIVDLARKLQDKDLPKSRAAAAEPKNSKPAAKKPVSPTTATAATNGSLTCRNHGCCGS